MSEKPLPHLLETAVGGLLQGIGTFMQRAYGTEAFSFFQWMEDEDLSFPSGIDRNRVRDMAVFPHRPEEHGALGWLAAEADWLAAGRDHKPQNETPENSTKPLLSPFCAVKLDKGQAPQRQQRLTVLQPGDDLLPVETLDTGDYQTVYRTLWDGFTGEFSTLCQLDNADLFCEGLLSLSERYTFAIPVAPVEQPDVSLHDHSRTAAAIAACLHAWHASNGSLDDERAVRDRQAPKFRLLAGDLSGIQHTLFILAHQQVKGVNKILRARSFLLGMLTEAAALRCRQALGVPVFNLIQNAGGRFVLLVPNLPELEWQLDKLRVELDTWLRQRYFGELALNLVLSAPFGGAELLPDRFPALQAGLNRRLEAAKLMAFRTDPTGVLAADYQDGPCSACGVRPVSRADGDTLRCKVCDDEHRVGSRLPRTVAVSWHRQPLRGEFGINIFGLYLHLHDDAEALPERDRSVLSAFRLQRGPATVPGCWALRCVANYVPRLREDDAYPTLDDDSDDVEIGGIKTFAMLAQDALETDKGRGYGKPYLAVLKADVDRLGFIFGYGLGQPTLSRYAALSRMLDLFFTGYLQDLLRHDYPDLYTVYAGGDDLLLIGPWRQTVLFAAALNQQFREYTGKNPNITLSAGLALCKANQPLNRTVQEAEERLEQAKDAGRDRVCLLDDTPIEWKQLPEVLQLADTLNGWLREGQVSTATVYRMLHFADQRHRAEHPDPKTGLDIAAANWRARWAYHLARNVRGNRTIPAALKPEIEAVLNRLLGLDAQLQKREVPPAARIPVSIALYRNRN